MEKQSFNNPNLSFIFDRIFPYKSNLPDIDLAISNDIRSCRS